METPGENGGPFPIDVNENEEETGCKPYVFLKDRNILAKSPPAEDNRCPASEDGGQEGGKGRVNAGSHGRNVNKESCSLALPALQHGNAIILDLVAPEKCLSDCMEDSCVISNLCGDHSSLNGFSESPVRERTVDGLDLCEGEGGIHDSGRGTVSCPAVLDEGNGMLLPLDRVSPTDRQLGRDCAGESVETPDSSDIHPGDHASGGESSIGHFPTILHELSCMGKHQRNCTCTGISVSDLNMPNGDIGDETYSDADVDAAYYKHAEASSSQRTCEGFGFCEEGGEEVKVANGGIHFVNTRATCDHSESDYFSTNKTSVPDDAAVRQLRDEMQQHDLGCATLCERSPDDVSEGETPVWPRDCPLAAAEQSRSSPVALDTADGVPYSEPSAKLPSPSPSTLSNLTSESPLTEPIIRDDVLSDDFGLPVRPISLRTNANISVSLSCDATPLSPEDGGFYFGAEGYCEDIRNAFEVGRRQSAPDKLPDAAEQNDSTEQKIMPKRFGIADFFTRSLFSRKPKEPKAPSHNATGWRLFGKASARENDAAKDSTTTTTEQEDEEHGKGSGAASCPQRPLSVGRRKNLEFEPLSTTALILEDRPPNLPAKSQEEALRHKQEYEEMVVGAKRREVKEAQRKKRQMKERHRQEESIAHAMVIWNNDILPHWDTMKGTRRVRELWWQGLPPSVRGRVWSLAIGNELNITPELYEIFLSRAKEKWRSYSETSSVNDSESDCGASLADRESSLDLIKLDISRTFPSLFIFQKGGPYHDLLHSVLGAYTCYRPDIGYVQGMSFIAAVLILNLEEADAFITFANLLNKPCQMAFFRVDHELMLKYFAAFEVFFEENLPRLFSHFQTNSLTPDLYLIDWIFTLYSKSLPLDVACRVWDVFCRDGEESLFRTGLGILRLYEDVLLQMDFIHIAQFLTRLPDDLPAHTLFTAMANTHMISGNRRWAQVFSALMKDGYKEDKNNSPALRS